ncbi:hypothetical protein [Streptomyces sp. NPDC058371]|uniref:hypothetical protein n=1 Tax=Streptomyces sp. NPDC058371 TaxID=3346463 RepID=UPI00365C0723
MNDFLAQGRGETAVTERIEILQPVRGRGLDDGCPAAPHARLGDSMAVAPGRARHALTQKAPHPNRR